MKAVKLGIQEISTGSITTDIVSDNGREHWATNEEFKNFRKCLLFGCMEMHIR